MFINQHKKNTIIKANKKLVVNGKLKKNGQ